MTKTCNKCNQDKPIDQFYKQSKRNIELIGNLLHGVDYYCKECRKESHKKSVHNNKKSCTIEGCVRPHYAKGICNAHYERARRDKKRGKPPRGWSRY